MKNKDANGRILKSGEKQLSDGRYEYQISINGKSYSVICESLDDLREGEERLMGNGSSNTIVPMTVNDAFEHWKKLKRGLKPNTFANYLYSYEHYVKKSIGMKKLTEIRKSDIKQFYNKLADGYHLKASTIDCVHTVLHQVLQLATDDGIIASNPSDRALYELRRSHNYDGEKKLALSLYEQKLFLGFVKNSSEYGHWYPIFDILLNTGMRVGEATALTWEDIDFEENEIRINKTLVYYSKDGKNTYGINTPKTASSTRSIPMIGDVSSVLLAEREKRDKDCLQSNVTIDGVKNFVFLNRFGDVLNYSVLNKAIKRITRDCNDEILLHTVNPEECILLPNFSCHNLRHTFATRLYECGKVDFKVIQTILGHSNISVTMDVYAKLSKEKRRETFNFLNETLRE